MKISNRIKQRREELQMSQEKLAHLLGYKSRSSINKIEKDASGLPQNKIADIAKALKTTPSYIMGWEDEQAEKTDAKSSMDELQKALMSQEEILFDGEPIDNETRDLLLISLRNTMELAEKLSKNRKG